MKLYSRRKGRFFRDLFHLVTWQLLKKLVFSSPCTNVQEELLHYPGGYLGPDVQSMYS